MTDERPTDQAVAHQLDELLAPLPTQLLGLGLAFGALSVTGLLGLAAVASYWATDLGVRAAMDGQSVTGAFSVSTFLTVCALFVAAIFAGAIVDEHLGSRDDDETEADPGVTIARGLFIVPHLVLMNLRLLLDALALQRARPDVRLAVHLLREAGEGHFVEQAARDEAPAVFRSTLIALERAHLIERRRDNDERLRLTVEGYQLVTGW